MFRGKNTKKFINGFCEKDLRYVKKTRDGKIYYPMIGGTTYCEYGWMPLLDSVFFWNEENLSGLMDCIKKENYRCVGRGIYSNQFYQEVRNYSEKGRSGHYMRYSLFRFQGESLFYKTILIEGEGYFTKFDGEEVTYAKGGGKNPNGPNYYDTEKERWMINEKQFNDEKEENA